MRGSRFAISLRPLELAPLAALGGVLALAADTQVAAASPDRLVLTGAEADQIVPTTADDRVLAAVGVDHIPTLRALDLVGTVVAHQRHLPAAAGLDVLPVGVARVARRGV